MKLLNFLTHLSQSLTAVTATTTRPQDCGLWVQQISLRKKKESTFFLVIHLLLVGDIFQCGVTWWKYKTTQASAEWLAGLGESAMIRMKVEKCSFFLWSLSSLQIKSSTLSRTNRQRSRWRSNSLLSSVTGSFLKGPLQRRAEGFFFL